MENTLKSYKQFITADPYSREGKYWLDKLSGDWEKSIFPTDYTEPELKTGDRQTVNIIFSEDITHRLLKLANQSDLRLHILLVTGLTLLLHIYSGNRDIIIGIPVLKQDNNANFINTFLVLKNPVKDNITFKELLLQTRREIVEATENQNFPLETLPYQLNWNIPGNDFPLFDVAILLTNIHERKYLQNFETDLGMMFIFSRSGQCLEGNMVYNPGLYEKATVERIGRHFTHLLEQEIFNLDTLVSQINLVPTEEKQKILNEFNHTGVLYPQVKTLNKLFRHQVDRSPHKVTLVYNDRWLTYKELNRKASQLACFLKSFGVNPDDILGLMIHDLVDVSIGILGILKTGSAYLPIDTGYPQERIKNILEDSGINWLLCDRTPDKSDWGNITPGLIDIRDSARYSNNGLPREVNVKPTHAAYVIYTSGTTGRPKGIVVAHANAVNTLVYRQLVYRMDEYTTALQLFSYAFDGFVTSFFSPLIAAAKLILVDEDQIKDMWKIKEIITKKCVTLFISIPILYETILEVLTPKEAKTLKTVTLAGEKISPRILEETRNKGKHIEIVNEYGVTEAAVMSTIFRHQEKEKRITIGHPIANTSIYILDRNSRLIPIGVPGELCIAGAGVARGYLNNPQLTAEKFCLRQPGALFEKTAPGPRKNLSLKGASPGPKLYPRPYALGLRLYQTGDLARWLPDGNIEFIGRIDNQVKVSGFRIELGEIEQQLLKHELIKNAVVTAKENTNQGKYLCAYIVTRSSSSKKPFPISQLKQYLSINLPGYMIPVYFVELDQFPLTPNGKIDRNRLPEPETERIVEYIAPRDEMELKLVEIWQEVLGVKKVGIDDNFFNLGGDSIKSIQIAAKLQKFKIEVKVRDLFSNPTIRGLGKCVKTLEQEIEQTTVTGTVELTPAHLWFLEHNPINMRPFNQSIMLYRKDGFDETILEKVFTRLLEHHDALRIVFPMEGNNVIPKNKGIEGKLFHLEIFNLAGNEGIEAEIEKEASRIQQSIDVQKGPLVKLGLFKTAVGHHLLIAIHHFVVDGVSWRILFDDLATGFKQAEKGEPIEFQQKTHSFQYYAARVKKYAESETIKAELKYWKKLEETAVEHLHSFSLHTPGDNRKQMTMNKNRKTVSMTLDEVETEKLLKKVNRAYNTEINDVLLTALGMAVRNWVGVDQILVKLETHGREDILDNVNISRTVGWFTAEYPVLLDMSQSNDTGYRLKWVKETLRNVPNHGIGYGLLKYLAYHRQKEGLRFDIVPGIAFNYLGEFGQENAYNNSKIEFSAMKKGDNIGKEFKQEAAVEINGILVAGKLRLVFLYNKYSFEKSAIEKLVECYKENLLVIVRHCVEKVEKGESEATPSDLVVEGMEISLEELAEIEDFAEMSLDMEE